MDGVPVFICNTGLILEVEVEAKNKSSRCSLDIETRKFSHWFERSATNSPKAAQPVGLIEDHNDSYVA